MVTNYTYNANNWLTGKTNKKTDNTLLSQYTYTHYRDGNIYQENAGFKKEDDTWQVQNRTYAYDPQGRLKQVTEGSSVTSYTYDLRGNRLTKATGTDTTSYTYDLNNRLLSEAEGDTTTLYEYDDRGNLVSKRKETITSDTTTSDSASILTDNFSEDVELYTYNGFNQLSEYRTGGTKASYTYDFNGIRTSKTVNGNTTQFLLDGANVIGEIGANSQITHYIRGATGIIYSVDGSYAQSTRRYYTTNGHGDVVGLLDNTGTLTKSYTYDPFGVEQNIDTNDTNPFRYCGEYFDNESKDLYLRARYYSPATGRFNQQDLAMYGNNWYIYCNSDPLNYIDSQGLWPIALRYAIERRGGTVWWDESEKKAYATLNGKTIAYSSEYDYYNGRYGITKGGNLAVDDNGLYDDFDINPITVSGQWGFGFGGKAGISDLSATFTDGTDSSGVVVRSLSFTAEVGVGKSLSIGITFNYNIDPNTGKALGSDYSVGINIGGKVIGFTSDTDSNGDIIVQIPVGGYLVVGGEVTLEINVSELYRQGTEQFFASEDFPSGFDPTKPMPGPPPQ